MQDTAEGQQPRPILHLPLSYLEILLEVVSAAALAVQWLVPILYWARLPDRIPTHFGVSGVPDAWGPRMSLLLLTGIGSAVYALLGVLGRFPHTYNYPVRITEENAPRQYLLARALLGWLKAEVTVLFAYLGWQTTRVALGQSGGVGEFPLVMVGLLLATVAAYVVQARRAR